MSMKGIGEKSHSLYHNPSTIYGRCVFSGGAANPTSFSGKGVAGVTRLGAGRFRITLDDRHPGFLHLEATVLAALNTVDLYCQLEAEAVNTAGGGTVDFRTKTGAGSVDPAAADEGHFQIDLQTLAIDPAL